MTKSAGWPPLATYCGRTRAKSKGEKHKPRMSMPNSKVKYGSQAPERAQKPHRGAPVPVNRVQPESTIGPGGRASTSRHKCPHLCYTRATLFTLYLMHLSAKAALAASSPTGALALAAEEEVELQPTGSELAANSRPHQPNSHIYHIRASNLNGRFQLPVQRLAGSRMARLMSDQPSSQFTTSSPPTQTSSTFGTRSAASGSSTPAPGSSAKASEPCSSPAPEVDPQASSVAASSPLLRLTASPALNRTLSELLARDTPTDQASQSRRRPPSALVAGAPVPGAFESSALAEREELPTAPSHALTNSWPQAARGSASDSILSLIEEFDSKIVTNRTSGELIAASVESCKTGAKFRRNLP